MTDLPQPDAIHPPTRWLWARIVALCLILLVATALRVIRLDGPTLWWDEGNNAYFAHTTLTDLLRMSRATLEADPPVHRLALHAWLALLGDSTFHLRLLSAVCGVLTVALAYAWGRWQGGVAVGLLAAALVAVWPVHIYYSREAKAYPWVTLWAGLAAYLWLRYADQVTRLRVLPWLGAVMAGILALGAHYYAALWIAAQGLGLSVHLLVTHAPRRESLRRLLRWGSIQAAIVLGLLPWVLLTHDTALSGAARLPEVTNAHNLLAYLRDMGHILAAAPAAHAWAALLAGAALTVAIGLAVWRGRKGRQVTLIMLVLTPIALGFLAQQYVAFVRPRFVLYLLIPAALLAAQGLLHLRRYGWALAVALAIGWGASLPAAYAPFAKPEDDLRPVVRVLAEHVRTGDSVVVSYIWQEGILRMEAPHLPVTYHLGWFSEQHVGSEIDALWGMTGRLWLLTYRVALQHPANTGGWWLEQHVARAFLQQQGPYNLALYVRPQAPGQALPAQATFEGGLELGYAPLPMAMFAGDALPLTLEWRVTHTPAPNWVVFVHLVDAGGQLHSQNDSPPQNGLWPFLAAPQGALLRDERAVLVPAMAPPGEYTLLVGLYDPQSGQRARVIAGEGAGQDHVRLGSIHIELKP